MCRKLIYLVSFVVPVLSLISSAQAGEATADAFVRGPANDNTNYGTGGSVTLKNSGGNSYDRKGYIRFEVAGAVSDASLVLTVSTNNNGGGGTTPQTFTVEVYGLAESLDHTWIENEITWNNAPGNDTSSSDFTSDATLLGSFIVDPIPVGNVVSFSAPALVDFINSDTDGQITILLRRTPGTSSSHNLAFASKEHSSYSPPTLNTSVATRASRPHPSDEATDVPRDVLLSWMPGMFAPAVNGHIVYLSDVFSDVNDGIGGITQDANSYVPLARFDLGTTYYWRVDEVNAPPDSTVHRGEIWSFTIEPVGYPVDGASITATASSASPGDFGPEKTIDGSGLVNDQHSVEPTDMWLSGSEPLGAWIQYEFDKLHKLHEMWIWNSNQTFEALFGFGFKDVTVEYSTNGADWTAAAGVPEFAQAPGTDTYAHDTTVDLGGAAAKYVRLTATANWGGVLPQYGLSEVRFFSIPVSAREPSPDDGAADVDPVVTLAWRAGREAGTHNVYLSTDRQAVVDGNVPAVSVAQASYSTDLELNSTYYWRIDEVNDAETPTTWPGDVWSLSTPEYLVVENFESYNDIDPPDPESNRIFESWADGFDVATNGALVGYDPPQPSYLETTIVHGGNQSLPLFYGNTAGAVSSEITYTFAVGQDWTRHGVQTLGLWFYGTAGNTGQLYVKINGVEIPYDADASNLATPAWQPWNIDLTASGVNLASVTTLAVGIDGNGAAGTLYFDDIRLYPDARQLVTPVQPDPAGLAGHWQLDGTYDDSSGNSRHGVPVGDPIFAAGKLGQALSLDGVDDYVTITGYKGISADRTDPNNPFQRPFSVTCWINTTDADGGSLVCWGSSDGTGVGGQYQNFRLNDGRLRAEHGNGRFRGAALVNDGEWHHVAMTVAEGADMWPPATQLYVDGRKDSEGADTSNAQNIWNITEDADVAIGIRASHVDRFFTGMIDDARIYERVLTPAEVAGMAGRTLPFDEPL